jgi:hypothetical protein
LFIAPETQAQSDFVRASVRSVSGIARIYPRPQSGAFIPKRNDQLEPGNTIETGQNGRVVISLSDGGQITVLPKSRVILKDFLVAHSARELLDILVGRVLVKIHHVGGKPNPYRLNSPAASIAVRGTEFIVDVLPGGETLVLVREGLVEVWPHNNPGNKRLITPGGRVIVGPRGDISSAFPGPGSELNGGARFNGDLGEDYQRSADSVSHNSNEISPVFFSAFPDPHLDSLENPAYAAEFKSAEGRLLLLPSISQPYGVRDTLNPISRDPVDHSISPQLTFYAPVPGSRFVVGVGASAFSAKVQNPTNINDQYSGEKYFDNQVLRLSAYNISFTAAYSFGARGRTSAGVGIDSLSGDGYFSRIFNFWDSAFSAADTTRIYNYERFENSNMQFARTRLTFGMVHKFSEDKKLGFYYRLGVNSSDQENKYHEKYRYEFRPGASYDLFDKTNISTLSSEVGARFRASLTRRFFYGIEGSYLYERINSGGETRTNQTIRHDRYLARRARIGGGLGFALTSKILLNFDVAGGLFNNGEPAKDLPDVGDRFALSRILLATSARGDFLSAHAAIQTNLWRDLFLSASGLTTIRRDFYRHNDSNNNPNFQYKYTNERRLYNVGLGWKFTPNFTAEYLYSIDHSVDHHYQLPSHSLKLQYTFNLGITGEK